MAQDSFQDEIHLRGYSVCLGFWNRTERILHDSYYNGMFDYYLIIIPLLLLFTYCPIMLYLWLLIVFTLDHPVGTSEISV